MLAGLLGPPATTGGPPGDVTWLAGAPEGVVVTGPPGGVVAPGPPAGGPPVAGAPVHAPLAVPAAGPPIPAASAAGTPAQVLLVSVPATFAGEPGGVLPAASSGRLPSGVALTPVGDEVLVVAAGVRGVVPTAPHAPLALLLEFPSMATPPAVGARTHGSLPADASAVGGGALVSAAGWVTCALVLACVGNVRIGTVAGATSAAGVSPVSVAAASVTPLGVAAVAQLPLALALEPLFSPAAPPTGATRHGSVTAAASPLMLAGETSAAADAVVGLVRSGVVAPAPLAIGATSASAAPAAGSEISGCELASALAAACGFSRGADVSGTVTSAATVDGAVTAGSVWAAPVTPAGAAELAGCDGFVDACAPLLLADACVDGPPGDVATCTSTGDEVLGLALTDAVVGAEPPPVGLTLTVAGALTDAFTGAWGA